MASTVRFGFLSLSMYDSLTNCTSGSVVSISLTIVSSLSSRLSSLDSSVGAPPISSVVIGTPPISSVYWFSVGDSDM